MLVEPTSCDEDTLSGWRKRQRLHITRIAPAPTRPPRPIVGLAVREPYSPMLLTGSKKVEVR